MEWNGRGEGIRGKEGRGKGEAREKGEVREKEGGEWEWEGEKLGKRAGEAMERKGRGEG